MKKFIKSSILSSLIGLLGFNAIAQTADQDVTNGLADLAQHNQAGLAGAYQQFTIALTLSPTNETANALTAVTRLLRLPSTPAGSNFLNLLGFSRAGRDPYNWTSLLATNAHGGKLLPAGNTAVAIAFCRTNIMAALAASRTNLARITDPNFTLSLTTDELTADGNSLDPVTVDYGDILLLQAAERVVEFFGYTVNAQNLDVVPTALQALGSAQELSFQKVLSLYPSLLTLANPGDLAASKGALTNAAALYFAASDFIRNVRAPGAPALFRLSDAEANDEAIFRTELTNALACLNGPVTFSAPDPVTINASNYFAGTKTLRSLLPQFNNNMNYVPHSLPDYTFGGILVDEPAYQTEAALRHLFHHSYAGIYNGDGGLSDNNQNINNGNGGYGDFAVFVGTNQQAILLGTDYGDGADDGNDFGVVLQFSVDKGGNWQVNSNNFSAYGWIGRDGSFWGELDYTSGLSVYFNYADQESPLGPFQNEAGYYNGTVNGTIVGGTSKVLNGVLAADGEIYFCPPGGVGGLSQFGANNHFITTNVSGVTFAGAIIPAPLAINGTCTNRSGSKTGTWKLSRSASAPFDVPPVITKDLPAALTAQVGANLTLSLPATGSPPLWYQWYSNSVAIPNANSNQLVLGNVQFSDAGTYAATIENVGGQTNSAVLNLTVICNPTPPTNAITAPTPGEQVSNSLWTVTGKAIGKASVSNVLVQVNGGGWNPATITASNQWANWTIQVPLIPGSNTVQAYAVDTCDNVSKTNTVKFKYVVSAPLTIIITNSFGTLTPNMGTVVPNDNGVWLQISNSYSLTATAGKGFSFVHWTLGTFMTNKPALTFRMTSNLVIYAYFKDTAPPTNGITFPVANQKYTNTAITVTGKAGDNVGVAGVGVQINNGGWLPAQSGNGYTNWSAANLPVSFGTNTVQAYAMDAAGNVSVTNVVKFLGVVSPASLTGYAAILKPSVGKQELALTWGDNGTYAQTGLGNDTNANDYCAGAYTYFPTGPNTAVVSNMDIGMMSGLGVTNFTTMNLTFTNDTTAHVTWTDNITSGSGTMSFSPVANVVPVSLAGSTVQLYKGDGTKLSAITLGIDGTFNQTNSLNGHTAYGTYTITQYSPTVAILQENFTDPTDAGAVNYGELDFTSTTAGYGCGSYYSTPTYDSNPAPFVLANFKIIPTP